MEDRGLILVVDDEIDNMDVLELFLTAQGYRVARAASGEEALRVARKEIPDLVLLDIMMSGMNGFECCRRLRDIPETTHVPVIFLSACTNSEEKILGFEVGGFDYVTKPYNFLELEARIRRTLEVRRGEDELIFKARRDSLTGLLNRGAAVEEMVRAMDRCAQGFFLTCIMVDIDHFKNVNDTYGHAAGDVALRQVASTLTSVCRANDIVGRYGGEELIVMLLDTDLHTTGLIAERMRAAVADTPVETRWGTFSITISLGFAACHEDQTPEALMDRADKALYHAKHSGRNRVAYEEGGHVFLV